MEPSAYFQPSATFEVISAEDDGVTHRVILRGELDIESSAGLTDSLCALAHSTLIADLSELTFIDSSGVGSLLRAKEHVEATGNQLVLARPSPPVKHLFEVLGLDGLFDDLPLP